MANKKLTKIYENLYINVNAVTYVEWFHKDEYQPEYAVIGVVGGDRITTNKGLTEIKKIFFEGSK